jgi:hypothetical protein
MKPITLALTVALLFLAPLAPAKSVFQASLLTPPADARLLMGSFYFQVDNDEVEFVAIVYPAFGVAPTNLKPALSVPGRTVEFSLGTGVLTSFHGLYSWAFRNPFLPFELPIQYDEEGNPYLIDAPVILSGYLYKGRFKLPPGFDRQLLNGRGFVQLHEYVAGSVMVAATDERGNRER